MGFVMLHLKTLNTLCNLRLNKIEAKGDLYIVLTYLPSKYQYLLQVFNKNLNRFARSGFDFRRGFFIERVEL